MDFKSKDWIEHGVYGHGQIIEDGETFWLIQFVDHDEKKILKKFITLKGQAPYDGFAFAKSGAHGPPKGSKNKSPVTIPDFDDLLKKFLSRYHGGLSSPSFIEEEREYKEKAVKKFVALLGRTVLFSLLKESLYHEVAKRSAQVMSATNLVAPIEIIKFNGALKIGKNQKIFSEGLYDVLYGNDSDETRFERYVKDLGRIDVSNWPVATYFQFLKTKGSFMFMKPTVAKRMADSVGVALNYKPEPNWLTHSKLEEAATTIKGRLQAAGQTLHSDIDIQSFMWCAYRIAKE